MRKVIIATIVLMLLSLVACTDNWKLYYTDKETGNKMFYDPQSIVYEKDTVTVWRKTVLTDKGKAESLHGDNIINGIGKGSYSVIKHEINCSENTICSLDHALFDSEGNIIFSIEFSNRSVARSATPAGVLIEIWRLWL